MRIERIVLKVGCGSTLVLAGLILCGLLCAIPISLSADDTWTQKSDMPTARMWLSTNAVNGRIYAIGGTRLYKGASLSTVEEYNPATDTWVAKSDKPTARAGFSTSVVNGKIYAIGGTVSAIGTSTVEEYDPVTDAWTRKADMLTARMMLSASALNGRVYVIGGSTSGLPGVCVSTVEEYDTGFVPTTFVELSEKLAVTWGDIKNDR